MNKYKQYEIIKSKWIYDNNNATNSEYECFIRNLSFELKI